MISSSDTPTDAVIIEDQFIIGTDGDDSLTGGDGDDTIVGRDGDDTIDGGGGDDELSGNRDDDTIHGGDGNDTILASGGDDIAGGGEGEDRLDGGTGNDTVDYSDSLVNVEINLETERATIEGVAKPEFIFNFENALGGGGDDTLIGTPGDNLLDGGPGDDSLEGGAGDDTLMGDPGNDTLDGGPGDDTADYSGTDTGAVFDLGGGMVVLPDGTTDQLDSIEHIIATQGDDTIIGTENGDSIDGRGGDDVIIGNGGDDTVVGGDGDDSLVAGSLDGDEGPDGDDVYDGGDGGDTISFEDISESVHVDLGAGSAGGSQIGDDTLTDIENVFGGFGDDTIIGDSNANVLCGNDGDDTIDGSDGDDTLIGGGGDDTIDGGAGDDLIYGDSAAGIGDVGVTVRFAGESAKYGNTYGWYDGNTGQAQIIVANSNVQTNPALPYFVTTLPLTADAFDNRGFFVVPDGHTFNKAELDRGDPGALNLEVFDDDGVWKIRDADSGYVFSGAGNAAYFSDPTLNPGGLNHTSITGGLTTTGQQFQAWEDLPNLGDHDFNDVMFLLTLSCGLGPPGNDLLMGGAGDDTLFGNEHEDTLEGGDGDDSLMGNAGDDILEGGGGADSVYGDAGGDLILGSGSADDDAYYGGDGNDTVSYEDETDAVRVDLGAGMATGDGIGDDVVDGIENAIGGAGGDTLIGSAVGNRLVGNDGDDRLGGTAGDDTLDGGGGNDTVAYETTANGVTVDLGAGMATGFEIDTDTLAAIENAFGGGGGDSLTGSDGANRLVGNAGDDTVDGAAGNDTLEGGDGDDLILSGDGDDLLSGGEGADTFSFDLWSGTDTISDFAPASCGCADPAPPPSDKIDVSPFGFANLFELGLLTEGAIDGTWIRLSEVGGGDVFLEDVLIFDLTSDDFII